MSSSIYHIIAKMPGLEAEDMPRALEELVQSFIRSGLLRIDAYERSNFVRFNAPILNIGVVFSKRQLEDQVLLPKTRAILRAILSHSKGFVSDKMVEEQIENLKLRLNRNVMVPEEMEAKIARILVQSSHPVLFLLILIEQVEVFFSYSYNIGDMLDVISWQQAGQNSGMQSTNGIDTSIFVSAAGNPFRFDQKDPEKEYIYKNDEGEEIYGDGMPALARAIIIAGQEIGHFGDIMRDSAFRYVSRHASNLNATKAKDHVKAARISDMHYIRQWIAKSNQLGLDKLTTAEKYIKFYIKNKISGYRIAYYKIISKYHSFFLYRKLLEAGFEKEALDQIRSTKYFGSNLKRVFDDMIFNLEPKADVYSNKDKDIEEAIACVEALARVPQQVNKWGEEIVRFLSQNLYHVFYNELIPARIKDYEIMSGRIFDHNLLKKEPDKLFVTRYIIKFFRMLNEKVFTRFFKLR